MSITESWESLEESLMGPDDFELDGEPVEVPDADEANRTLLRVARIRRARSADEEVAAAQVAQVQAWLESRNVLNDAAEEYHLERLRRYHAAVLARDPKAKTISLPAGALVSRSQQPEWVWNEAEFLAWAAEYAPAVIRHKPAPEPTIDANAAKELLTRRDLKGRPIGWGMTEDGIAPPGVDVVKRDRKFDVELSTEEGRA